MAKLPRDCSGAEAVKAFQKDGWVWDRQKSSHVTADVDGAGVQVSERPDETRRKILVEK